MTTGASLHPSSSCFPRSRSRAQPRGKPALPSESALENSRKPGHIWDRYLQPKYLLMIMTEHNSQRHRNSERSSETLIPHLRSIQLRYSRCPREIISFLRDLVSPPQLCGSDFINMRLQMAREAPHEQVGRSEPAACRCLSRTGVGWDGV